MGPHYHNKLTPRFVASVTEKGMYHDGGGLYLQVKSETAKSWLYRYEVNGHDRQKGLGPLHTVGLADARELARECRLLRLKGIDPIEHHKAERLAKELQAAKQVTFETCACEWLKLKSDSPKAHYNLKIIVEKHLIPALGKFAVNVIDVDLVEKTVTPQWHVPNGKRMQECIEAILDWATAKEYRKGDNPASLKGPLGVRLKPFTHTIEHYPGLPFQQVGAFMTQVRSYLDERGKHPLLAYVIEFMVLTAVRVEQATSARWDDIPEHHKLWVCQKHKTKKKSGQPHVIPLSKQAWAVIETMRAQQKAEGVVSDYVFAHSSVVSRQQNCSHRIGKAVNKRSVLRFVKKLSGRSDTTNHGFRTTFGDWSVEHGYEERDSEMALGHMVGNNIRNIYKRNAYRIEPRRLMLQAWADYCDRSEPLPAEIVQFNQAK